VGGAVRSWAGPTAVRGTCRPVTRCMQPCGEGGPAEKYEQAGVRTNHLQDTEKSHSPNPLFQMQTHKLHIFKNRFWYILLLCLPKKACILKLPKTFEVLSPQGKRRIPNPCENISNTEATKRTSVTGGPLLTAEFSWGARCHLITVALQVLYHVSYHTVVQLCMHTHAQRIYNKNYNV